jgi:hypothetical protein
VTGPNTFGPRADGTVWHAEDCYGRGPSGEGCLCADLTRCEQCRAPWTVGRYAHERVCAECRAI